MKPTARLLRARPCLKHCTQWWQRSHQLWVTGPQCPWAVWLGKVPWPFRASVSSFSVSGGDNRNTSELKATKDLWKTLNRATLPSVPAFMGLLTASGPAVGIQLRVLGHTWRQVCWGPHQENKHKGVVRREEPMPVHTKGPLLISLPQKDCTPSVTEKRMWRSEPMLLR